MIPKKGKVYEINYTAKRGEAKHSYTGLARCTRRGQCGGGEDYELLYSFEIIKNAQDKNGEDAMFSEKDIVKEYESTNENC